MTKDDKLTIPKLKNRLQRLEQYLKEYSPDKLKKLEEIHLRLELREYKIAVVANMSAGKSTFINALFGSEILPAYSHATTDCATYIYSEPSNDKKAVVYFNDGKEAVELGESELSEINQYAQKDEECEDDMYKNVEKIDLYYPFKNIQTSIKEDFKILFVDTPGPNSTGDGYKQKHKDQTRSVLNEVDLALFLFDYEQLDANLGSDEQGLWHTIKTRHEGDKDFDIYFLLNKIDGAFDDNFKDIDTKDKDKFIEEKRKNWFVHEQEAIDKLRQAAIEHGIEDPKIYPISSKFALYKRDRGNINFDELDELEDFEKKHFQRLFLDKYEEELIKYLGFEKLEKDINDHIDNVVKEKIINKLNDEIDKIIQEENSELVRRETTLKKPKEEAEENLKKANEFLHNESKSLQDEMKSESSKIQYKYSTEIQKQIDGAIKKELKDKVGELAKRTIYFAQKYTEDSKSISAATKKSTDIPLDTITIDLKAEEATIKLNDSIEKEQVRQEMQNYMITLLQSYKNNYLDIKTDIKESYHCFDMESSELLKKYKGELEQNINKVLDIEFEEVQTNKLELSALPSIVATVPDSVLDYKHENAQYKTVSGSSWYKPWTWGDTKQVKTQDEKHIFSFKPKELFQSIQKSVESSVDGFYLKEIEMHKSAIKKHLDNFLNIFQDFRHEKDKEILGLTEEIKKSEASLRKLEFQKKNISTIPNRGLK